MNQLTHPLTICNTSIRQDTEGRYCLNDLHRAAGGEANDGPGQFLRRSSTDDLQWELKQAAIAGGMCKNAYPPSVVIVNDGISNGTFVVKELVYAYAMWISPKFHLQVIRAYDSLVMGRQVPEEVPETPELLMSRALPRPSRCPAWRLLN